MPGDVIRQYLITDTTDTTAAAVAAAYPTYFTGGASSVPVYAYQSLLTLMACAGTTLDNIIISEYGEAKIPATVAMVIQTTWIRESVDLPSGLKSDDPGAEYAQVDIWVRNVSFTRNSNIVKNISLRVRYLLDLNLRQFRSKETASVPPGIPTFGDPSIKQDYVYCIWMGAGKQIASEWSNTYMVQYERSFPINNW